MEEKNDQIKLIITGLPFITKVVMFFCFVFSVRFPVCTNITALDFNKMLLQRAALTGVNPTKDNQKLEPERHDSSLLCENI